jgi:hypothetical protein
MATYLLPPSSGSVYQSTISRKVYTGTAGVAVNFDDQDVSGATALGWTATTITIPAEGVPSTASVTAGSGISVASGVVSRTDKLFATTETAPQFAMSKWQAAKQWARSSNGPAFLAIAGDSTSAGTGGVGGAGPGGQSSGTTNTRMACMGNILARLLDKNHMRASMNCFIGTSNWFAANAANYTTVDSRLVIGASWAESDNNAFWGGGVWTGTGGTATNLDFTPEDVFDTFDVLYTQNASTGDTLNVLIDGVSIGSLNTTAVGSGSQGSGFPATRFTVSGLLTRHKISLATSTTAGKTSQIQGIVAWDSKNPGIIVLPGSTNSTGVSNILNTSNLGGAGFGVFNYHANALLIMTTVNDQVLAAPGAKLGATPASGYTANTYMAALFNYLVTFFGGVIPSNMDVVIAGCQPSSNSGGDAFNATLASLLAEFCAFYGYNWVDFRNSLGQTYTAANSAGLVNGLHPTYAGYERLARQLYPIFAQ